jgi:hypothetical protein
MPKRPRSRRRIRRSCLAGGKAGNVAFGGSAGSYPPEQPTGPTRPGGSSRSYLFRWRPSPPARPQDPPEPDDES